jgi:tRNA threonylcarbamoyladenosine biosynthesis protein TsaB
MTLIALDAATDILSAGLSVKNTTHRYYFELNGGRKHSEQIMDAVEILLRTAGVAKAELEGVACMEGPGSFTGLRIGFAAAKGLALALGIPIVPVPTLDCMSFPFSFWPGIVLPVIDAKKNSFFTALYRQGERVSDYLDIDIDGLLHIIAEKSSKSSEKNTLPLLVTGPAAELALPGIKAVFPASAAGHKKGYAAELLDIALKAGMVYKDVSVYSRGPLYLRKSDAELNETTGIQHG